MQNFLKEAVKNYLESIEVDFNECKVDPKKGLVAKISTKGDKNYDVYIVIPKIKLDYIAELWFGDSSDYDEKDLLKEIANQIVGNAKVIAEQNGIEFEITTPEYIGDFDNSSIIKEGNDILKFKFKNRCFYVIFKEV